MPLKMYSIYDKKAASYGTPFFMLTDGAAMRAVIDTARDPSTTLYRHPGDFTLVKICSFDEITGLVDASDPLDGSEIMRVGEFLSELNKDQDNG